MNDTGSLLTLTSCSNTAPISFVEAAIEMRIRRLGWKVLRTGADVTIFLISSKILALLKSTLMKRFRQFCERSRDIQAIFDATAEIID